MNAGSGATLGFVPLRMRLIGLLTLAVLVFGLANLLVVGRLSYTSLAAEQARRVGVVAELLATQVVEPLLHDDRVALAAALEETLASEPDLIYIVIKDQDGRDRWRAVPGTMQACESSATYTPQGGDAAEPVRDHIREQHAPILAGALGGLRVGASEKRIRAQVARLLATVAGMVATFLLVGIGGAVFIARRITSPLEATVSALDGFLLEGTRLRLKVATRDEMEILARRIEEIADRLQDFHRNERERDKELSRVERLASLGTLAAALAHELNNPLAGIRNAATRLASHTDDAERVARYAGVIGEASARMERSLNDLLGLARTPAPDLGAVDACQAIFAAVELASPRLTNVRIVHDCPQRPPLVRADRERLGGALLNLILNAADAVAGRAEAAVTVRCDVAGDDKVRIEVEDNGPGIPEELRERIFDPFFTTKPKGTGLGLSTAFSAVQGMGGRLRLKPDTRGACFVVELARSQEADHG